MCSKLAEKASGTSFTTAMRRGVVLIRAPGQTQDFSEQTHPQKMLCPHLRLRVSEGGKIEEVRFFPPYYTKKKRRQKMKLEIR